MRHLQYGQLGEAQVAEAFKQRLLELQRDGRRAHRQPIVGHKQLDMYHLFRAVQARGGSRNVTQWKEIGRELDLPTSVTNAGYTLRTKYESHIQPYEEILDKEFPWTDFTDPSLLERHVDNVNYTLMAGTPTPQMHGSLKSIISSSNLQENIQSTSASMHDGRLYYQPTVDNPSPTIDQNTLSTHLSASKNWLVKQSDVKLSKNLTPEFGSTFDVRGSPIQGKLSNIHINQAPQLFGGMSPTSLQQLRKLTAEAQGKALHYNSAIARPSGLKRLQILNQNFTDDNIVHFLSTLPAIEALEIGSLKNLTVMFDPSLLPASLVSLQLNEIPSHLLSSMLQAIKTCNIQDLSVTIYGSDSNSALIDMSKQQDQALDNTITNGSTMITRRYEPIMTYDYPKNGQLTPPNTSHLRSDTHASNTETKKFPSNDSSLSIDQGSMVPMEYSEHLNIVPQMDWYEQMDDFSY